MNAVDITIIISVFICAYIGYKYGAIRIIFLAFAPVGAWLIMNNLAPNNFITAYVQTAFTRNPQTAKILSWLILAGVIYLAGVVISKIISVLMLGFLDKIIGLILATISGIFIINFLQTFLIKLDFLKPHLQNSIILSHLNELFK